LFNNLIAPATSAGTTFNFWNVKIIIDTLVIVVFGLGIYVLGFKSGFMTIEKKVAASFFSLDKICCDAAKLIEAGCVELKKLHTKNLNEHLLWVFLTLGLLLVLFYFRADFLTRLFF